MRFVSEMAALRLIIEPVRQEFKGNKWVNTQGKCLEFFRGELNVTKKEDIAFMLSYRGLNHTVFVAPECKKEAEAFLKALKNDDQSVPSEPKPKRGRPKTEKPEIQEKDAAPAPPQV